MSNTILDAVTRPLVKKIAVYVMSAIAGAAITVAVQNGWLDAAGAETARHLFEQLINAGASLFDQTPQIAQ